MAASSSPVITVSRKEARTQYSDVVVDTLDQDRKAAVSTDAVLKLGQTEFKVHKCVLSLQSDFFKACFSDRWDSKDDRHAPGINMFINR